MRYTFSLEIPAHQMARYYQGSASDVQVRADNGQRLKFAARHLRSFLTPQGVYGRFELQTDENQRFLSLKKLS
jgi:hypothetical protein